MFVSKPGAYPAEASFLQTLDLGEKAYLTQKPAYWAHSFVQQLLTRIVKAERENPKSCRGLSFQP